MTNFNRIRVVVLGSSRVGKSAVTVRYLTKRFIGEYSSSRDFLYKHTVVFDGGARTEVEILDTSKVSDSEVNGMSWSRVRPPKCSRGEQEEDLEEELEEEWEEEWEEEEEHLRWGDAFVVVYSVCDRRSFRCARRMLARLSRLHGDQEEDHLGATPLAAPALLLGNKRDLDHCREIGVDAGQELSLRYGAQFYEVSAAQSYAGVSLAFHSLLREARSHRLLSSLSPSSSCSISPFLFDPPPHPLHRLLRSLSSSSSSSSSSASSPFPSPAAFPHKALNHKRARLGVGNSVSRVLGTIFGKNGGGGGDCVCGDRKAKKKRPSLSI